MLLSIISQLYYYLVFYLQPRHPRGSGNTYNVLTYMLSQAYHLNSFRPRMYQLDNYKRTTLIVRRLVDIIVINKRPLNKQLVNNALLPPTPHCCGRAAHSNYKCTASRKRYLVPNNRISNV